MELTESKFLSIVTLAVGSIIVGLLPKWFTTHGRHQWPLLLSCLLCFGGGVLISTSLVHILPELREAFPEDYKKYSELFFCAGFFVLYIMDEIVHFFFGDTHEQNIFNHQNCHSNERRHSSTPKHTYGTTERDPLLERQRPYNPGFYRARSDSMLFFDGAPSQLCHVGHQEPCQSAPTSSLGLLVALSLHSLLEGLVVGLENSTSKVLLLLGAIASHKLVVGFCLGVELASNNITSFCRHFVCILIFSGGSVLGILGGMVISNMPYSVTDVVIPILQGLAGGTLLYVTVSEILPRERARWHQQHDKKAAGVLQFLSVASGFALMTILSKYLDH